MRPRVLVRLPRHRLQLDHIARVDDLLASVSPNEVYADVLNTVTNIIFTKLCGYFIAASNIVNGWYWVYTISYFTYALRGLAKNDINSVMIQQCVDQVGTVPVRRPARVSVLPAGVRHSRAARATSTRAAERCTSSTASTRPSASGRLRGPRVVPHRLQRGRHDRLHLRQLVHRRRARAPGLRQRHGQEAQRDAQRHHEEQQARSRSAPVRARSRETPAAQARQA